MKVKFLIIVILLINCTFSQRALGRSDIEGVHFLKVKKEIQLLNLINGLELNNEQVEFIIQKAKEAAEIREEYNRRKQEKETEFVLVLQDLRENLLQGKVVSSDLKTKVRKSNKLIKELKDNCDKSITDLAVSIKNKLYGHQLYSLEQYVSCLIPPEEAGRIGQVKDSKGIERLLNRTRNMREPLFEKKKETFVQQSIEMIRKHLPKGFIIEEENEKNSILSIIKEARTLNDIDFALEKTELAQSIISKYELPELPTDISVKIEKLFLQPEIILLLKEELSKR